MTYPEAVTFLYERLPAYERGDGAKAIKPGLDNIRKLLTALGDPHTKFRSIHVGGTNGKGSSSHMLAAIYQAAGYRVGLYTSPHLKSFTERIRLNGQPIPETAVATFIAEQSETILGIGPSFFEVTVAMAFDYFACSAVDIAIVEVGLGGRLDSTNIITPVLSLITNIGWDHQDILGNTLAAIAQEKAGIIKPGVPIVISEYQIETVDVFKSIAQLNKCKFYIGEQIINIVKFNLTNHSCQFTIINKTGSNLSYDIKLDLTGSYQRCNLRGVLTAVQVLQPIFPVDQATMIQGLSKVAETTGLKGRWQLLGQQPTVIVDTAHNVPGIQAVLTMLNTQEYKQLHVIFGVVNDKDVVPVLALLPDTARYYFCSFNSPRSQDSHVLMQSAATFGLFGNAFSDVNIGLQQALQAANENDLILIMGSTYLVSELDYL